MRCNVRTSSRGEVFEASTVHLTFTFVFTFVYLTLPYHFCFGRVFFVIYTPLTSTGTITFLMSSYVGVFDFVSRSRTWARCRNGRRNDRPTTRCILATIH